MEADGHTAVLQHWLDHLHQGDEAQARTAQERLLEHAAGRLEKLTRKMFKDYARLRRWEQTGDVLQNALLRLHRALSSERPRSVRDFLALAATQIRREQIDLSRHHFGPEGQAAHHHTDGAGAADGPAAAESQPDPGGEPATLLAWGEFHDQVGRLPDAEREVFGLLWYEGLTQHEAAAVLGVTERTVKNRWRSAKLLLQAALGGMEGVSVAQREKLDELLARWDELRAQGRAPSAEELAAGDGELAGELRAAIERLRAMDWLDEPSARAPLEVVDVAPTPRQLLDRVPPLLAGRYRMEHVLADGGFSQVWRALDTALERPVAVKVTAVDCVAEARRVARLRHPGIVGVHDVGSAGSLCFIVFDLIEGTDLAQRLRDGPLPWAEAAALVAEVAELLHYAHEKGFIHRDVKPANILLDREGKPVLADFGIAVTPCELLQETISTPGTLAYMAPEQLGGSGQASVRTDVYGLGIVLYQALTGQLPFREETLWGLRREILTGTPQRPRALAPDVPPELESLCLRCLAKDPGERPATAAELASELRGWRLQQ